MKTFKLTLLLVMSSIAANSFTMGMGAEEWEGHARRHEQKSPGRGQRIVGSRFVTVNPEGVADMVWHDEPGAEQKLADMEREGQEKQDEQAVAAGIVPCGEDWQVVLPTLDEIPGLAEKPSVRRQLNFEAEGNESGSGSDKTERTVRRSEAGKGKDTGTSKKRQRRKSADSIDRELFAEVNSAKSAHSDDESSKRSRLKSRMAIRDVNIGAVVDLVNTDEDNDSDEVEAIFEERPTVTSTAIPGYPNITNADEEEGEGSGDTNDTNQIPGHNDNPRLGFWNSLTQRVGGLYSRLTGNNTPVVTQATSDVSESRFGKHKKKMVIAAVAGVVLAAWAAKSLLSTKEQDDTNNNDNADQVRNIVNTLFGETSEDDNSEDDSDEDREVSDLLASLADDTSITKDGEDSEEDEEIEAEDSSDDESIEDYERNYAELYSYLSPLRELKDKLEVDAVEGLELKLSLINGTPDEFDGKVKELNDKVNAHKVRAHANVLRLAEVVKQKYAAGRDRS